MEQGVLDKKTNVFKIVAGVFAIAAAIWWGRFIISQMDFISFVIVWDAIDYISVFDVVDYLSILNWFLIRPIILIITMVLFALYIFVVYEKKHSPLLGLSATAYIVWAAFTLIMSVITVAMDFILRMEFSSFVISGMINIFFDFVIAVGFVLMSLKFFGKIKLNIKYIPIIIIVSIAIYTYLTASDFNPLSRIFTDIVLGILHVIPFAIFTLFCPIIHKNYENDEAKDT